MEFKDRLSQRMRALNLSATDLSKQTGVSKATISFWVNGTNGAKGRNLLALAKALDCSPDWLSDGVGSPTSDSTQEANVAVLSSADLVLQMLAKHGKGLSDEARTKIAAATTISAAVSVKPDDVEVDFFRPGQNGDEVWIAHYDVRGAMGGGQVPDDYPEMLQDVRVSPQHLRSMGVEFKEHFHLKVVTGWGQSMAPTIKHRDPILVDVSIREFVGDGIYLFSWGGHLYIKRLQMKGADHFKMISDNKHHDTEEIRVDETYIQARVLLVWNANLV